MVNGPTVNLNPDNDLRNFNAIGVRDHVSMWTILTFFTCKSVLLNFTVDYNMYNII